MDSVGTSDPASTASSARWLRIKREGNLFHFYASWDGVTWDNYHNEELALPTSLLVGFSTMTDSGAGTPPLSAYANNGHTIDPNDPLNPATMGGSAMNESNYAVQRVRLYPNGPVVGAPGPLSIAYVDGKVQISWPTDGTLQSADAVTGSWQNVAGQTNPYVVTPAPGSQRFYRLAR